MRDIPSTALAAVDTLVSPRGLNGAVELALAAPASRVFPTRRTSSLGICGKRGPAHHVRADGVTLEYPADSVCVRPPGCVWSSEPTGQVGFVSIDIAADALPEDPARGRMQFLPPAALPDLDRFARLMLSSAARLEKDEAIAALVTAVAEHAIVAWREPLDRGGTPAALEHARTFLDAAVEDNPSLDEVAAAARLNKHVLIRRFRERFGTTPHAYLTIAKVDTARGLLARGTPVSEVAHALGFADQPHLTRVFRRSVGIGPATYQRQVRALIAVPRGRRFRSRP